LTEVLVYPLRAGNAELARQYQEILFQQANLASMPVSSEIARLAAQIRAVYNFRTPDAIQVATAMGERASFFLTNDRRLSALPNLEVLVLDELIN
jgi:predicted nucleic acid-binding protein